MTTFVLKLFAAGAMLLDHIGAFLQVNTKFIQSKFNIQYEIIRETIRVCRGIGRLSFPIFAFLLVIGYKLTSNKQKYLSRLLIFAIVSQIPYSLLFSNYNGIDGAKWIFFFNPNDFYLKSFLYSIFFMTACLFCYYKFIHATLKDSTLQILFASLLLNLIDSVKLNDIRIIGDKNNIFYTLAFGIYVCYCYDYFIPIKKIPLFNYLLLVPLLTFIFTFQMDYGVFGVVLICALYCAKKYKPIQSAIIFLWGFLIYNSFQIGYGFNMIWWDTLGVCLASILVLLYNGKKGRDCKRFFYLFYPLHLLILGIINVIILNYK